MNAESYIPDTLIAAGQEIVATKYLSIACAAILFYEYFLTFSDEVQYAWRGNKTWVFFLFLMNRYLPIAYKIWDLSYDGQYLSTQLVIWNSEKIMSYCSVTTFTENSYVVLVTLSSQLFLAVRVSAVKGHRGPSFTVLSSMIVMQFAYGVAYVALFRREAYTFVSLLSPTSYTFAMCLPAGPYGTSLQLVYLGLSLAFDIVAFLMVAVYSYGAAQVFRASGLFGRVIRDATVYFLVIVWAHLTVTIYTSLIGDSRILRLFPAITNTIVPIMVCRLVLSLRKAAGPGVVRAWNVDHFSTQIEIQTNVYRGSDDVLLSPLSFRHPTLTVSSFARGGAESEESGLLIPGPQRSLAENQGWTIDGPEEDELSRRERDHRIP